MNEVKISLEEFLKLKKMADKNEGIIKELNKKHEERIDRIKTSWANEVKELKSNIIVLGYVDGGGYHEKVYLNTPEELASEIMGLKKRLMSMKN